MEIKAYFCPFGINIGDLWSGPPPVGRIVSLTATRLLMGTIGQRRSAKSVSGSYSFSTLSDSVEMTHSHSGYSASTPYFSIAHSLEPSHLVV